MKHRHDLHNADTLFAVVYRRRDGIVISGTAAPLKRPRQPEHMLRDVFAGEPEAAVSLEADVRRLPGGLGREVLRHVRLGAAGLIPVEKIAGLPAHQVRGLELDVALGDRELHALVLAYRS